MVPIEKILFFPEGKTLEFKRDLSSLAPILKTLVAFANTAGGTLIIGKEDRADTVIGVEDVFVAEEKLANAISDSILPRLIPDIEIVSFSGKSFLIIRVSYSPYGPFYIASKGDKEGVFIRIGSTNRVCPPERLSELQRLRYQSSFDQLPCLDLDKSAIDEEKIKKLFLSEGKSIDTSKLISLGIFVSNGNTLIPSQGGIILFGKLSIRQRFFPNSQIRCARFLGTDKTEFLDQIDIEESLVDSVEEAIKFIRRNTKMSSKIEKIQREDIPEYSPIILREVLLNAIVHTDYSIQAMHPRIMIFSDRMEIESPGLLPPGYTLDDFMAGISHIRNKVIARTMRELHKIEQWGTGYKRILTVCEKGQYPMPLWEEIGNSVKVTLYPYTSSFSNKQKKKSNLTTRQTAILEILTRNGKENPISSREIHSELGKDIAERTVRADLQFLQKNTLIQASGKGPSTCWSIL